VRPDITAKVTTKHLAASLFAIWALPLLLIIAIAMPPWMNSDEPFHMLRAVNVAHGGILGVRSMEKDWAGGPSDPAIYDAYTAINRPSWDKDAPVTAAELADSDAVKWHREIAPAWFGNTVQYAPFFYVPDAVSYWIGRALGLHVNRTLLLARIVNAVIFTLISAISIAVARQTRPFIMAVLMLPMSIALGASASQDAILIPVAALTVAWLDRMIDEARAPPAAMLAALASSFAMLGMARAPYGSLTLLLFAGHTINRRAAVAAGVACVVILTWSEVVATHVMVPMGHSNPSAQWRGLIADPARVFSIVGGTAAQANGYFSDLVGRLAWVDRPLPVAYRAFAGVVLALAAIASSIGAPRNRPLVLFAMATAILAIFVLQYFDWTRPGMPAVTGVVGRYFTPLAMASALALPSLAYAASERRMVAYAALATLAIITPAVMLHHIALRFYVS
jgi:uncharacterized membrane protein